MRDLLSFTLRQMCGPWNEKLTEIHTFHMFSNFSEHFYHQSLASVSLVMIECSWAVTSSFFFSKQRFLSIYQSTEVFIVQSTFSRIKLYQMVRICATGSVVTQCLTFDNCTEVVHFSCPVLTPNADRVQCVFTWMSDMWLVYSFKD